MLAKFKGGNNSSPLPSPPPYPRSSVTPSLPGVIRSRVYCCRAADLVENVNPHRSFSSFGNC